MAHSALDVTMARQGMLCAEVDSWYMQKEENREEIDQDVEANKSELTT